MTAYMVPSGKSNQGKFHVIQPMTNWSSFQKTTHFKNGQYFKMYTENITGRILQKIFHFIGLLWEYWYKRNILLTGNPNEVMFQFKYFADRLSVWFWGDNFRTIESILMNLYK